MKRNIFKLMFVALAVTAVSAGCEDQRNNNMVDDTLGFIMTDPYVSVSLLNESYELAIIKSGKGLQDANSRLIVSELALAEYNAVHGTNYELLPAEYYNVSATNVTFSKDDIRKIVEITWDDQDIVDLGDAKQYVIPLQLYDENDYPKVDQGRNTIILHPSWSYVTMASPVAAAMSPAASRETKVFNGSITIDNPIKIMDITVNYSIDNTLIDAYNTANGTSYLPAPAGLVSLAAQSSTIAAGEASTAFAFQLNSASLFEGNILKAVDNNQYLVPVRITSLSNDLIGLQETITYIPIVMNKRLIGPWTILEGQELCVAEDPLNGNPDWYNNWPAQRLFDGDMTETTGDWVSYINTLNVFPMTFVADMGESKVFTKFLIKDASTYQGALRDYEMYTAETYNEGSTEWTLVASGTRGYDWVAGGKLYDFPVQKMAAGRYLKIVFVKHSFAFTDAHIFGRCRLSEIYGEGF